MILIHEEHICSWHIPPMLLYKWFITLNPQQSPSLLGYGSLSDVISVYMYTYIHIDLVWTGYVDGLPISEVTPVINWYIHPPHHGHTNITVMVWNDRLTSLSFHINQPPYSWNGYFKLWYSFITILTWQIQAQCHRWGKRSRSHSSPSVQLMTFPKKCFPQKFWKI